MIRTLLGLVAALAVVAPVTVSGQTSPAPEDSAAAEAQKRRPRVYFGGSVSFNIGTSSTRIGLEPLLGINLSPKVSLGTRLRYEYLNDRRGPASYDSHNYGGGVFSRYRFIPQLYAHAEYSYMSYGFLNGRRGVPFLLLGGGYLQPLSKYATFYAEVLVDLINDEDSPYDSGSPRVSFGVNTGF